MSPIFSCFMSSFGFLCYSSLLILSDICPDCFIPAIFALIFFLSLIRFHMSSACSFLSRVLEFPLQIHEGYLLLFPNFLNVLILLFFVKFLTQSLYFVLISTFLKAFNVQSWSQLAFVLELAYAYSDPNFY